MWGRGLPRPEAGRPKGRPYIFFHCGQWSQFMAATGLRYLEFEI